MQVKCSQATLVKGGVSQNLVEIDKIERHDYIII
jgi:hypothetical protein